MDQNSQYPHENSGLSVKTLDKIVAICKKNYGDCGYVVFTCGSVVFYRKEMDMKLPKNLSSLVPEQPEYRVPEKNTKKAAKLLTDYLEYKLPKLDEKQRRIYVAALRLLCFNGYPYPGTGDANNLVKLHDDSWRCQYVGKPGIVLMYPKEFFDGERNCSAFNSEYGVKMDMMFLIPYYINVGPYDTQDRVLDNDIFLDPYETDEEKNPYCGKNPKNGIRVFSTTWDTSLALKGIFKNR
jgi:hypothetical protein